MTLSSELKVKGKRGLLQNVNCSSPQTVKKQFFYKWNIGPRTFKSNISVLIIFREYLHALLKIRHCQEEKYE